MVQLKQAYSVDMLNIHSGRGIFIGNKFYPQ